MRFARTVLVALTVAASLLSGPAAASTPQLGLQRLSGEFAEPVHVTHAPDGSGRLFVVERKGLIRVWRDGAVLDRPFLDVSPLLRTTHQEQGLLGLAFHPRYVENGRFVVNFTDRRGTTIVAGYRVSSDPDVADPGSAVGIIRIEQPAANHNGGHVAFGPDGHLWLGTGDGGGSGDQFGNAQDLSSLLGKMLRIDVDSAEPYAIPPDNPFVGQAGIRPEIWAYGLRNPWRYAFDRQTGDLFIADVGQNRREEIHVQPSGSGAGANYGWPIMEGARCFHPASGCDPTGLELPAADYDRSDGCSVTGGHVYRGSAYPDLVGWYVFGDFCTGKVWILARIGDAWNVHEAGRMVTPSSFGEDQAGELYAVSLTEGRLYRVAVR
jgi:glucose/arabinose dehydrogenase